jgi:hypothetical protein
MLQHTSVYIVTRTSEGNSGRNSYFYWAGKDEVVKALRMPDRCPERNNSDSSFARLPIHPLYKVSADPTTFYVVHPIGIS